jgi:hypothetical protein
MLIKLNVGEFYARFWRAWLTYTLYLSCIEI